MQSHHTTGSFRFEQLEQRRMLSGTYDEVLDLVGYDEVRVAALAVPGLDAGLATAGEQVPFRGSLEGTFTSTPIPGTPNALVLARGAGQATQLGQFSFDFPLTVNLATQTGGGIYTFTAANGDTVIAQVEAQSALLPNGLRRVAEIATITGGTGRFENASGGFVSERFLDRATGAVVGSFEGTISAVAGAVHQQ
jgi:hypothetical protein